MIRTKAFENILSLIPSGADNAIPMMQLAALLDVDERKAREYIQKLRMDGVPILSVPGDKGYFFSSDPGEIQLSIWAFKCRGETNRQITQTLSRYSKYVKDGGSIEEYLEKWKEGKA